VLGLGASQAQAVHFLRVDLRITGIEDNVYNTNLTLLGVRIPGISDNEIQGRVNV
jgi:hypothetical protein